ncbi:2-dehydropantoate 2-reductase [Bradyrhizobium prioriisuperbiae]|uniref:2-dehydropantoate 2-reductase n=1 Tax=Bradyrhizobium prioriisuperbiae TaxID=2854389 RepID=UPI0028E7F892|nr:2-dehydropantoate 2-reductase [Bradyrhizobium prioritasuperba]
MSGSRPIVVAGAGSIGCFVGGMLALAGHRVVLLARPRVIDEIKGHGLRLTSFEGADRRLPASALVLSPDEQVLRDAAIVLVCVKSADTAEMAATIAAHAPQDAVIVSLQNGVANVPALKAHLASQRVLAGMVPFNVVGMGEGRYHRSTSGDIIIEQDEAATAAKLSVADLKVQPSENISGVQWGKLLVNLGNALNALSNLPLREQLSQRSWRMLIADQMSEALAAMKAEGIDPVSTTPLPASWVPYVMRLPDWAFQMIAKRMVQIDPQARSSMWDDLQRGRRTEIDYLQGAIIEIAQRRRLAAPLSSRLVALIKDAEARGQGSPGLSPEQIRSSSRS